MMTPAKRELYAAIARAAELAEQIGETKVVEILDLALDSIRLAPWMPTPAGDAPADTARR